MCCILLRQPSNLVDLLLNLEAFQVVKLRLVALEGAVNVVLSTALRLILALNNDKTAHDSLSRSKPTIRARVKLSTMLVLYFQLKM